MLIGYAPRAERRARIKQMREEQGLRFTDIAREYGFTAVNARYIYLKAVEHAERDARRKRIRDKIALKKPRSRPIDMGGPRGVWLEFKLGDGQP